MNTINILEELTFVHQNLLKTVIAPAITGFNSESKFTTGFYGEDDGYCVDGYAMLNDKDVTFSISLSDNGLKASLFYQNTGKKIPCIALSKELNATKAYLSKKGMINASKFENRVLRAFNDVYCGLLLNKSKHKEMPMFSPSEQESLYIEHYVELGNPDYVALLTLKYNSQNSMFEFTFTSDDEDNGDQCEIILSDFETQIAKSTISELTPLYRSALIEHGVSPRFVTLEPTLISTPVKAPHHLLKEMS